MQITSKTHMTPLEREAVSTTTMAISKLEREQESGITCPGKHLFTLDSHSVCSESGKQGEKYK